MRVESPTPALPPKKSKQPPPRPAPPKATGSAGTKGPQRPAPPMSAAKSPVHGGSGDPFAPLNDPFAAAGTSSSASKDPFGGSGFADFASFDTKVSLFFSYPLLFRLSVYCCFLFSKTDENSLETCNVFTRHTFIG